MDNIKSNDASVSLLTSVEPITIDDVKVVERKGVKFWIRKVRKQDIISVVIGTVIAITVWVVFVGPTYH
jgi:hypothetical protein